MTAAAPAVVDGREPTVAPEQVAGGEQHPRLMRVALVLGAIVGMADATVVAVALDPLSRHFGQTLAAAQAVIGVYLVTVTATLPLLARLGDRFGRRRAYVAGFVVFAAGSVVAALAPGYGVLLAGRAIQACGGGLLTSGSLALVSEHAHPDRRGRSIASLVVAQALAGLVAPPLGGALVALFGWQSVFWGGIPLAAAGVALTLTAIPRSSRPAQPHGLDPLGSAGLAALLLGIGAGIAALGGPGIGGLGAPLWFAVAAAGLLLLLAAEPRTAHPLVDRRLLSGRFGRATLATFLSTGSLMSCFALLPFWLENAHGVSAALAGAALLPVGVGIAATSRLAGRLADSGRTLEVTTAGMATAALGLGMAAIAAATELWPLLPLGLLVLGAGNGLFSSPNTASAMAVAPLPALSGAAGLLSTARNAGVIAGLGATGAAYTAISRTGGSGRADIAAALLFTAAGAACLAVAGLARMTYRPGREAL